MATGGGDADRDTVLGWMARTGKGYHVAADHFALPVNRVKSWVHRDRVAKRNGTPRTPASTPDPVDASGKSDGFGRNGEEGDSKRLNPLAASRARTTPAAELPNEDRLRLRGAVRRLLDFLDSDAALTDPKKAADAARALDTLLARCPDILSFEEKTNGSTGAEKGKNEAEALADAFGVKLPAA